MLSKPSLELTGFIWATSCTPACLTLLEQPKWKSPDWTLVPVAQSSLCSEWGARGATKECFSSERFWLKCWRWLFLFVNQRGEEALLWDLNAWHEQHEFRHQSYYLDIHLPFKKFLFLFIPQAFPIAQFSFKLLFSMFFPLIFYLVLFSYCQPTQKCCSEIYPPLPTLFCLLHWACVWTLPVQDTNIVLTSGLPNNTAVSPGFVICSAKTATELYTGAINTSFIVSQAVKGHVQSFLIKIAALDGELRGSSYPSGMKSLQGHSSS